MLCDGLGPLLAFPKLRPVLEVTGVGVVSQPGDMPQWVAAEDNGTLTVACMRNSFRFREIQWLVWKLRFSWRSKHFLVQFLNLIWFPLFVYNSPTATCLTKKGQRRLCSCKICRGHSFAVGRKEVMMMTCLVPWTERCYAHSPNSERHSVV